MAEAQVRAVSRGAAALVPADIEPRAERLANRLRQLQARCLGYCLDNGPDWLVADRAAQLAEVCAVPLPQFFSQEQLHHAVSRAGIDQLLHPAGQWPLGTPPEARCNEVGLALGRPQRAEEPAQRPRGTGKITFTSGSTGQAKGVCLSNAQLQRQAEALSRAVGLERPRHLCVLPLATLLENVAGVYAPWLAGGAVLVPPLAQLGIAGSSSLDAVRLADSIGQLQPNSLILTPQLLMALVAVARHGWQPPGSLRFVAVGGARVAAALIDQAWHFGLPVFEGYGLSECASVVTLNTTTDHRRGSCGRALEHLDLRVEDGEITVRGNPMLGYLGDPDSWYPRVIRSGDMGRLDGDGYLHIDGRRSNLIISSYGRNISPEWVESELVGEAVIGDCVVFGEAQPYCVALLTTREPATRNDDIQHAIDRLNARLPDYARVRRWRRLEGRLAADPELFTPNGRPQRDAIQARYKADLAALYDHPQEAVKT